jgi:hypothetical protein
VAGGSEAAAGCATGVSDIDQLTTVLRGNVWTMSRNVRISGVEQDGDDGLIVTFSDGTTAGYVAEELLGLRPVRQPVRGPKTPNLHEKPPTRN